MKNKWYETRLVQYLIYGLLYMVFWKLFGFEFTMVVAVGFIAAESDYKTKIKNRNL